jgi:hypothetical protein
MLILPRSATTSSPNFLPSLLALDRHPLCESLLSITQVSPPTMASLEKQAPIHTEYLEKTVDATVNVSEFRKAHSLDSIEDTKPGPYVWLCAAATAIGGMLFGYDTCVISGVLVVLGSDLNHRPLSDTEKELITILCAVGAFIGAIVAGITADKYGRKPATWFGSVLFTLGAVVQSTSFSVAQMLIGRLLVGLGVGSASMVCFNHFAQSSSLSPESPRRQSL